MNVPYFEISAKTGANVEDLFMSCVDLTMDRSNNAHILHEQKDVIKE